jgi:hypothetical protein
MNAPRRSISLGLAAGTVALLFACTSNGPGQLELKLVDAPNPAVDQIVVNVAKVTAHSTSGGWTTVGPMVSPTAVNLLDLRSSAMSLGLVNLPVGTKITQVRLVIASTGNYVVQTGSTTQEPLVVPSGIETGVKILGPWDIPACHRLTVTLDFDGMSSIHHQADGTWVLRPVIRLKKDVTTAISCEPETPPAPPAPQCSADVACPVGEACDSGACVAAAPLPTGTTGCTDGSQCLTGSCSGGVCTRGVAGASCSGAGDCVSSSCVNGACAASSPLLGAGATCSGNGDCLSGSCAGLCLFGMPGSLCCQPGMQGALCVSGGDCLSGICTGGLCAPPM